ncbi:MAG TPA: substrate-binding domain-containing protein, partial [Thermoflexales bacterium]|nr:substrate-binding domain-containing protein [Thermoflexales bacterium]
MLAQYPIFTRSRFSTIVTTLAALALAGCAAAPAPAPTAVPKGPPREMTLSTTTSTNDSGLLPVILPDFEAKFNAKVKVVAVGTGAAIKLGQDGNADVVLVHARALEDDFVKS